MNYLVEWYGGCGTKTNKRTAIWLFKTLVKAGILNVRIKNVDTGRYLIWRSV